MSRSLAHCSLSQWDGSSLSVGPTNDNSSDACLLEVNGTTNIDQHWSERQSRSTGTVLCCWSGFCHFLVRYSWLQHMSVCMKAVCTCLATVDSQACLQQASKTTYFWKGASILREFSVALLWSLLRRRSLLVTTAVKWSRSESTLCSFDSGFQQCKELWNSQ